MDVILRIDLAGSLGDFDDGSAETLLISPSETAGLIRANDSIPR